jgi:2-polyprenyl-6-methoxyphenol hydroxylase-like FAD-dependent oxidoreductase
MRRTRRHLTPARALAMEDALVLAKCIGEDGEPTRAFAQYHGLRQARVDRVARQARRSGQRKAPPSNAIGLWVRDRLAPFFLKRSEHDLDWIFSHRIDWQVGAPR